MSDSSPGRGVPRGLDSLRHRNFRLFWFGQMISLVGSAMQSIGQAWLVLQLTQSAWQLGLVGALQALPILFFSLFGGVFADRWPKRRVLLITQSAAMIQALVLWALIVTGAIRLWHLYLLALLLGLTNSLDRPTRQAFTIEMVGRDDLPNAVALNSSLGNLARIIGPGLGGVIIAASSVTTLFLLNGLSFIAVLAGLALMRGDELYARGGPPAGAGAPASAWASAREGLGYVWRTPAIMLLILVVGLVLLFGSNFNVLLPLFANDVLHVGAEGFGFFSAALGLGALASALALAWGNRKPTVRGVLIGALIFTVLEAVFAVSRIYLLSLVVIAGVGYAENVFAVQAITALQAAAPDHLRGRVMSVYILFFDGSLPLGYLLTGWLATLGGPSAALLICAAVSLVVVAAGWLRRPAESRAAQA